MVKGANESLESRVSGPCLPGGLSQRVIPVHTMSVRVLMTAHVTHIDSEKVLRATGGKTSASATAG